jgi:hypothetical protein
MNRLAKTLTAIFSMLLITGCVPAYKAVETGDRAKINLTSPKLESTFLYDTDLDLIIYQPTNSCSMKPVGKLRLNPGEESISTYVSANDYGYFKLAFKMVSSGIGFNSTTDFAFYLEDGAEYTVEYDNSGGVGRHNYYKHDESGKKIPLDAKFWSICKKQKGVQ